MKALKFTLAIVATATVVFVSCQKSSVTPASSNSGATTLDAKAVAQQLGTAFFKSIAGQYGGANIGDGIKSPGSSSLTRGPRVNSIEPYCGYKIDTTDNFDMQVGDTLKNVDSKYKFIYTCSSNALDGYVLTDSVTYTDKGQLFINKYLIAQNYIVNKAADDFSAVSLHGTLGDNFVFKVLNSAGATTDIQTNHTEFALSGVKINIANSQFDIVEGTVTFIANLTETTNGNTITGGFTGTMTFLGNHDVSITVTYQGKTTTQKYQLNYQTFYLTWIPN